MNAYFVSILTFLLTAGLVYAVAEARTRPMRRVRERLVTNHRKLPG